MTAPGLWCVTFHAASMSPERLTAHFFTELLGKKAPALRITSVCGTEFPLRRRPKPGEVFERCAACEVEDAG